ncbi:hypothetical protein L7F22_032804 [Adiantum nelumboides]|nr:hypothetical protein [Adiantum nelumboides]
MVRVEQAGFGVCDVLQEDESVSASDVPSCSGLQHCRIPEMDSVVASITGYVGEERSNLIKLINSSGACYVGKLLKGSTTHLVCWTFDGPKFEMAKRFQMCIVNHRWFEDCCKSGKRLDESPYTILSCKEVGCLICLLSLKTVSGQEVGAVLWKVPKWENSSLHYAKSEVESPLKYAYNKDYQPHNTSAESFRGVSPYHGDDSFLRSQRNLSDEILNVSDDDHELQVLLQNKPTQRDKGKRKASLISKNRSFKPVSKLKKDLIVNTSFAEHRKYPEARERVTHSILEYVHLIDAMKVDNNKSFQQRSQLDDFEECNEAPFTSRAKSWGQKSFTLLTSMRHRKKRRLLRKSETKKVNNCFDILVSEGSDRAQTSEDIKATPRSACKITPRREVIQDEHDSSNSFRCKETAFDKNPENVNRGPVVCTLFPADIDCAICHTDQITSAEGVLSCGHHFCYHCIMKWALEVPSKTPTCPFCKAPFDMITKREQKPGSRDNDVFYEESVVMLGCVDSARVIQLEERTPILSCIFCGIGDMQDLLLTCSGCGARSAHSFCLDPPLPPSSSTPWSCGRCSQRRRADTTWWHQLHLFDSK